MTFLTVTNVLIAINAIVSISAFSRTELMARYQFNAYMIHHRKQWYRFITHAFLHADWTHLIVNMFVLFSFGNSVERWLGRYFGDVAPLIYLGLYFTSIVVASVSTYRKNKDNHWYNAVGASGAVSAVLFSGIVFDPFNELLIYGIIPVTSIIFAVLYIAYSIYSSRNANDNVNHDAHLWGSIYGVVFTLLLNPAITAEFFTQIQDKFR